MSPLDSSVRHLPYWRLSGFYGLYFALVGALIPYWGLYLKSLDYRASQIGVIAAAIMATKVVAPNVWGWLADRSGRRLQLVRLGAALAWLSFGALWLGQGFAWMLAVVLVFTFFWNAILAQFEVVTLDCLGRDYHRYSHIRLWGSVGFIVTVMGLGFVFDHFSIGLLPLFVSALLLGLFLLTCTLSPVVARHSQAPAGAFIRRLVQRPALVFFTVCFLLQLSHGPYYTFFSLYLVEGYGYRPGGAGLLWALGVVAEIVLFVGVWRYIARRPLRQLLLVALALTVLRWLMTAVLAEQMTALLLAQCLHAFSFALAHAACIEWVRRYFYGPLQGQGQACYSAASFGAGGALGAVLSGLLWDLNPEVTFLLAAAVAALAFILVWVGLGKGEEVSDGYTQSHPDADGHYRR